MLIVAVIVVAVIVVIIAYVMLVAKKAAATTPSGSGTPTTPGQSGQTYAVTITATDSNDPYVRNWTIYTGGSTQVTQQQHTSGQNMNVNVPSGNYTVIISQSGGSSYGTYSGTIQTPSGTGAFSGADSTHAIAFTVP